MGLISRDTFYVSAKESVFNEDYLSSRDNNYLFDINQLSLIPNTNTEYNISADVIEKEKLVFKYLKYQLHIETFSLD